MLVSGKGNEILVNGKLEDLLSIKIMFLSGDIVLWWLNWFFCILVVWVVEIVLVYLFFFWCKVFIDVFYNVIEVCGYCL